MSVRLVLNLRCGCISFVKKTVPRQRCLLNCGWGGTLQKGEDGEKLRIQDGPGRHRPNKQGELVGNSLGRSKLLSFGKSRPMNKPSKTEMVSQNLCNFTNTESCWSQSKTDSFWKDTVDKVLHAFFFQTLYLNLTNNYLSENQQLNILYSDMTYVYM